MLSPVDASGYETRGKIYEALGKKAMAELDFLTARLPEDMRRNLVKTSTASSGASGSASGPRDCSGLIVILGIAGLGYFMFKGRVAGASPAPLLQLPTPASATTGIPERLVQTDTDPSSQPSG